MFWVYKAEGSETFFCGAMRLREMKWVAVWGGECSWKLNPYFAIGRQNINLGVMELREM